MLLTTTRGRLFKKKIFLLFFIFLGPKQKPRFCPQLSFGFAENVQVARAIKRLRPPEPSPIVSTGVPF